MVRRIGVAVVIGVVLLALWGAVGSGSGPGDSGSADGDAVAARTAEQRPVSDAREPVRGRNPKPADTEASADEGVHVADDAARLSPEDPDAVAARGTVRGAVVDAEGRPIPSAQVWLAPAHVIFWFEDGKDGASNYQHIHYRAPRRVADGEGRYEFREVPMGGAYKVFARAAGFAESRCAAFGVPAEEPVTAPDVMLPRLASLVVTVVDPDGATVDEADVSVEPDWSYLGSRKTTTGPGVRRFEALAPGECEVFASRTPYLAQSEVIELAGGEQGALTIRLERGGVALAGTVVDTSGAPAVGVTVRAREVGNSPGLRGGGWVMGDAAEFGSEGRVATDAQGRFRIDGLREGRHEIEAVAKDGARVAGGDVEAPADDVRLSFPRHGELSGRVLLPPGVPVPDAMKLTLHHLRAFTQAPPLGTWTIPWAADGRFARDVIPEGAMRRTVVELRVPECAPYYTEFSSPGAEPRDLGDVRLELGLAVVGRVVDAAGTPIAGASVRGGGVTVGTDADGAFRIRDLARVAVRIDVSAPGYAPRRTAGTAGDAPLVVELQREAVLRGRVLDANGNPMPEANVGIFYVHENGKKASWHDDCFADHRGVFEAVVPPGRIRLGTYSDMRAGREPGGPELDLAPGERTWLILRR